MSAPTDMPSLIRRTFPPLLLAPATSPDSTQSKQAWDEQGHISFICTPETSAEQQHETQSEIHMTATRAQHLKSSSSSNTQQYRFLR